MKSLKLIADGGRRNRLLFHFLSVVILGLGLSISTVSMSNATLMVYDHFDDGALDPAWTVTLQDARGWSYLEAGSTLGVDDISPAVIDTGPGGQWATATLSRQFSPVTDFHVDFDFAWDSEGNLGAMQYMNIGLYDETGNRISKVWYFDGWTAYTGRQEVFLWDGLGARSESIAHPGSLPLAGKANVDIRRGGSLLEVYWDGVNLLSGRNGDPLGGVSVEFGFYARNTDRERSFFGSEAVDLISIDGAIASVPEPGTVLLFGLGLVGLAASRKLFGRTEGRASSAR